jgi:hypothetical protein
VYGSHIGSFAQAKQGGENVASALYNLGVVPLALATQNSVVIVSCAL